MFGRIGRAISRPVRGIGRIARGNVRQGLGDIGEGARAAAPALAMVPGVGTAAAIGIGAAGGALERAGRPGANLGTVAGGAGRGGAGAAAGAAAGRALGGIGSRLGMGGGAGTATAGGPSPWSQPLTRAGSGGGRMAGVGGALRGIGNFARENPELAGQALGAGASMYGAHQEGRAADRAYGLQERQVDLSEEQYRERMRQRQEALDRIMERRNQR